MGERAGPLTKEYAQGNIANSDTSVSNAEGDTHWCNAGGHSKDNRAQGVHGGHSSRGEEEAYRVLQQRARTPVRGDRLEGWLSVYGDEKSARLIRQGFKEGFRLGYEGPRMRRWADNLKSAKANRGVVQAKLDKEVSEGRMAGPFSDWPMQNLIISPVGIVPKKELGQFRLIQHL